MNYLLIVSTLMKKINQNKVNKILLKKTLL